MSEREWKPGDVAMVRFRDSDGPEFIGICTTPRGNWRTQEHGSTFDVVPLRPLVVIDPEDAEQVERLARTLADNAEGEFDDTPLCFVAGFVAAALREFANPTPSKPDEPTGLGAVVEDADGQTWLRDWKGMWRAPDVVARWAKVDAVRILSHGVTEGDR